MTLQTTATAITGLVAGWMCNDASGTLTDFGSNNLPLTVGAQGGYGGAAVIPECARSFVGTAGSGIAASRAVTGGTPLSLTAGVTLCGFFNLTAVTASGGLAGHPYSYWLSQNSGGGAINGAIEVSSTIYALVGRTPMSAGESVFAALTYDGNDVLLVINGTIEGRLTIPGSLTTNTNDFEIGSFNGTHASAVTANGVLVFNRALSLGELRQLMRAGDSAHTIESTTTGGFFDLVSDGNAAIAAAAQTRFCGFCGGLMRANERGATVPAIAGNQSANTVSYHPTCHAASQRTPVLISSGSTIQNYGTQAIRLINEYINAMSKRTGPGRAYYFDTIWQPTATEGIGGTAFTGAAAAILARYMPGKRSPWNQVVRDVMTQIPNTYMATSGPDAGSFDYTNTGAASAEGGDPFAQVAMGLMVLLTKNSVEKATWNAWRDRFLQSVQFLAWGPNNINKGVANTCNGQSDFQYWTNGNYQVMYCLTAWMAYKLTGSAFWLAQYQTLFALMITGPTTGFGSALGGSSNGAGLVDGSTSTLIPLANLTNSTYAIGATGQAYLTESSGSNAWGLDWDYLQLQLDWMHILYLISGDARAALLMSLFWNQMQSRITWSPPSYSALGGTRHNLVTALLTCAPITLYYNLGRSDISLTNLSGLWTSQSGGIENNYRAQGMVGNAAYYRGICIQIGALLMAQPDWPGLPL